jgi:hypothetical protein
MNKSQKSNIMFPSEYNFDGYTLLIIAGYAEGHLQYRGEKEQQLNALMSEVHRPEPAGSQNRANFRNRVEKPGPGIGYGCYVVENCELGDEKEYHEWKARWEQANMRPLEGYVWAVWTDWTHGAGYMPHETLMKIIDTQEAIFAQLEQR